MDDTTRKALGAKMKRITKGGEIKCRACNGYGFTFTDNLEKHNCDVCNNELLKIHTDHGKQEGGKDER